MVLADFLNRLKNVSGTGGQYSARCPAHDDRRNSLSVSVGKDGRILCNCFAGCDPEDITAALGLTMRDLFADMAPGEMFPTYNDPRPGGKRPEPVAVYTYPTGAQKLKYPDKHFAWRHPDGAGGWIWNQKGVPRSLYVAGELKSPVFVVEGEKDADSLHALGYNAVSGENGAGPGKWRKEYTNQLKGLMCAVLHDNDDIGRDYGEETAAALHGAGCTVYAVDLAEVWPEIPEHGDVSDMIAQFGPEAAAGKLAELMGKAEEYKPPDKAGEDDSFLSMFKPLTEFTEEEAEWLIVGWIPKSQLTLIAGDGGTGKTSLWVHFMACLSSGRPTILDPPGTSRPPVKVAFCTTEDSVRKKLMKKIREAGANMENIIAMDPSDTDALRRFKFGRPEMELYIRHFRPAANVFDPIQGFVPPDINMGSRNAMRDCMAPLISLGEETGTTFLNIAHTNKRKGAYGRARISDSADLWDISRSVIMLGETPDPNIHYISNEKNNYTNLQDTVLFSFDDHGQIVKVGTTHKRDRDYMQEFAVVNGKPKLEETKDWILQYLKDAGGDALIKDMEAAAVAAGLAKSTLRKAKDELSGKTGEIPKIRYYNSGGGKGAGKKEKIWHVALIEPAFSPVNVETPFEELPEP